VASSQVNSYNIDNSKRIFPPSGMIDRASAEISKCIMRLKRKDGKKPPPPEIPPKPANILNNSNNHNNRVPPSHDILENGGGGGHHGGGGGGGGGSISTGSSSFPTNKHGGIAVLPHHITTLNSITSGSASSSNLPPGSVGSSPTTPRKFPTLSKKTPKHKKLLSHHSQLWNDEDFLKTFFSKYFTGSDKLVLPIVCRKWRDVTYGMGRAFWGDLIPVLKCKELRGVRPDLCAGIRRRFYGGLVKRG